MSEPQIRSSSSEGEHFEHRLWLRQVWLAPDEHEAELDRLNREFGWRVVGYMPSSVLPNGTIAGYFLLERPEYSDEIEAPNVES